MNAALRVLNFSFVLGRKAKRTKFFFVLGFVPVLLALLLRLRQVMDISPRRFSGMFFYSNVILPFYLQFLLLMLALFYGRDDLAFTTTSDDVPGVERSFERMLSNSCAKSFSFASTNFCLSAPAFSEASSAGICSSRASRAFILAMKLPASNRV